jgi:hypothetical protein
MSPTVRARIADSSRLPAIAAAVVSVCALAAPAAPPSSSPALSLTIGRTGFYPDEGTGLPAGRTYWFFAYLVTVHSDEPCAAVTLDYRWRILADGRLEQPGAQFASSEIASAPGAEHTFKLDVGFGPDPGEVVVLNAVAACRTADGTVVASAHGRRAVQIPSFSCEQGPLRVKGLRGSAWREDTAKINRLLPIHRGDFLWTPYTHRLGRRSLIVFGAERCHGYRVVLTGRGGFDPGTYARRGRGDGVAVTLGMAASIRSDQHSGGAFVEGAFVSVQPRGRRHGPARVAEYELRSWGPRTSPRTRLIVRRGAVWLRYGRRGEKLVRAPASVQVVCDPDGNCRLG